MGAIADELLTPRARAAVQRLLADDRDKFGAPSGRTSLEAVSEWADEIRQLPGGHPHWHYDNIPVCGRAAADCPGGDCNSVQLPRLIALLGDPSASLPARNEALKWVVHLLADLHQPLHAADNEDHGGNDLTVALAGVRTRGRISLHRAWDSELVPIALGTPRRHTSAADIPALAKEARELVAEAGQGTPAGWSRESNQLARNVAYRYPGFACGVVPGGIVLLDRPYVEEGAALARERLLLAGGRLAGVLNTALR